MEKLISRSTKRNWEKLGASSKGKLSSRANKRLSEKHILPLEYINVDRSTITDLIEHIQKLNISPKKALYSIGVNLLIKKGIYRLPHVQKELGRYRLKANPALLQPDLPENQRDLLGLVYQCLISEGQKNSFGSYYTPHETAASMLEGISFKAGDVFLDPCCGSGSFILELEGLSHNSIFGIDKDPIAVMLARINMLLKFPEEEFEPQIYCGNFLENSFDMQFSHIVTNPPWGAACGNASESFSQFFLRSFELLKPMGEIRFLLPTSFLNVQAHKDLRRYILENASIEAITLHKGTFAGVLTKYTDIRIRKASRQNSTVTVSENAAKKEIPISAFRQTDGFVFSFLEDIDLEIIKKARQNGPLNLKDSIWALGIVTGNNKKTLSDIPKEGFEPIYTGKEMRPYVLMPPKKYIKYDPSLLQQTAKEELYRAEEKLVYKFIGKRPVFAVDRSGALLLNSANMLIPKVNGMCTETVGAFMNSDFAAYFYKRLFGEVKILKSNLVQFPLPEISPETDSQISALTKKAAGGDSSAHGEIQSIIYEQYGFTEEEISRIKKFL